MIAISNVPIERARSAALDHAVAVISRVCALAAAPDFVTDVRTGNAAVRAAIVRRDTPAVFDWLVAMLSYQGISNQVARSYLEEHGSLTWREIEAALDQVPSCPKLQGYWRFWGCGYHKTSRTCSEPEFGSSCPLPEHEFRNGRLNQSAYSLYFFIRDVAAGDFVGWIDAQLHEAHGWGKGHGANLGRALIDPLRNVYGVSDKVLSMALSGLLMAAPRSKPLWIEAGAGMLAVDTLVHNFLHRTGILHRFKAEHPYGVGCYGTGGCAAIVEAVASRIDVRQFNRRFPPRFPRFVQHAIWRFCAETGLNVCNGNQITDSGPCDNRYCQVRSRCDRIALNSEKDGSKRLSFAPT